MSTEAQLVASLQAGATDAEIKSLCGAMLAQSRDWTSRLRVEGKKPILDEENILICLQHDPALQALVRFDEFAQELIALQPVPGADIESHNDYPRPWKDSDTVDLQTYLQRNVLPRIGRDRIESVLGLYGRKYARHHPLQNYLTGLQWDGGKRVCGWLCDYLGAYERGQPQEYVDKVGELWIVSAVARAMQPGCQVDYALVLEGPQGFGKTTALRTLAGDRFFSDSLPHDLASKDARDHLRGKWIIELPELAQFRRSEIETVKAFLSRREERYRPSYGRHEIVYRRQCVFAGSTNEVEYLVDTTGNRRFWPVTVGKIDIDALGRDRDQIWAEAVHLYRHGERWHPDRRLEELAAAEAGKRMVSDPWVGTVQCILDSRFVDRQELTPGAVLGEMELRESERSPQAAKRVGAIMAGLGWRPGRKTNHGRYYYRGVTQ